MSSSDDRRRPRVAGQRRRHGRPAGEPEAPGTTPETTPEVSGPAATVPAEAPAPEAAAAGSVAREPIGTEPVVVEEAGDTPGEDTDADTDIDPHTGPAGHSGERARRRLPAGTGAPLAALVLALVALALVLSISLRDPGAREADARAATAAARSGLEQLLSYSYQTLDRQAAANAALLTGAFKGEYAKTMSTTIAPVAVKDEVTVRARTYEAGVMGQTPDTVTVQVFLNQAKTAKGEEQPSVDQNRVIATMRRVDGRWLIEKLSAY